MCDQGDAVTLTNPVIREMAPGATVHDDKVKGLHVRATGKSRTFYFWFRTRTGIQRRPKVGTWPDMTIDEARKIARGWGLDVAAGKDPVAMWRQERGAPTIADLYDLYMERHAVRKKTADEDKRIWEKYILRRMGARKVADIVRLDIEILHGTYRGRPYQGNRILSLLSKAFSLAEAWDMRPANSNPCHGINRYREAKRRRYLGGAEVSALCGGLLRYQTERPQAAAFLLLLLFTGARPSEIAAARWDQLKGNRIELDTHKTDQTGAPRVIFLPPPAVDAIAALPRTTGTICGIQSPRALWRQLLKDTGLAGIRIYDLRHTFASAALGGDLTLAQIGELLGHRSTQTTARYAHLMEDRGVEQATKAAGVLTAMMKERVA
jgi:integrase